MFKSILLGALVALILILGSRTMASKSQHAQFPQRRGLQPNLDTERKKYQEELPDATPVQHGDLSHRQRAHSKLFAHYRELAPSGISDLVAYAKAHNILMVGASVSRTLAMDIEPVTPEHFFGKLVNSSDAVIRGKVIKKTSQITENDGFVFTDYDIEILAVLKNNNSATVTTGSVITVTRQGGKVLLDGIIVNAQDVLFAPLPLNNDILFFSKLVPETGAYQSTDSQSSFEFDGPIVRPLTELPVGVLQNSNKDAFLKMLNTVLGK